MLQLFRRASAYHQGLVLVLIATLLFSFKGIFIKFAYVYGIKPGELMFIRMMIALPFYLFIFTHFSSRKALSDLSCRSLIHAALLGCCGYYLASYFDLTGLVYLPANIERLVLYTYPSIVLIFSIIFWKVRVSYFVCFSLLMIYVGLCLVFYESVMAGQDFHSDWLKGGGLVFLAAISFSIYLMGSEKMMKIMPSRIFTAIAMISACVLTMIHFVLNFEFVKLLDYPLPVFYYALAIALLSTVLPSFMLSSGVRRIGAAAGSAVGSLGPVITLVFSAWLLGEVLSMSQFFGFMLVLVGVLSMSYFNAEKNHLV